MLAPALVLAAGCGDDDDPTGNNDGSYALVSIDGERVPISIREQGATVEIRSGTLTLDDGEFELTFDVRVNGERSTGLDGSGTYERSGDRIVLTTGGVSAEGTIDGDELVLELDGSELVFERD